jgi:hypothetical protein
MVSFLTGVSTHVGDVMIGAWQANAATNPPTLPLWVPPTHYLRFNATFPYEPLHAEVVLARPNGSHYQGPPIGTLIPFAHHFQSTFTFAVPPGWAVVFQGLQVSGNDIYSDPAAATLHTNHPWMVSGMRWRSGCGQGPPWFHSLVLRPGDSVTITSNIEHRPHELHGVPQPLGDRLRIHRRGVGAGAVVMSIGIEASPDRCRKPMVSCYEKQ